jgi:hypothetical protein
MSSTNSSDLSDDSELSANEKALVSLLAKIVRISEDGQFIIVSGGNVVVDPRSFVRIVTDKSPSKREET